ncbi:HelD family protein [Candidatus Contubernalis alkaliaceticus]|uniref:HelD family protein n=1 Tax=Candidatus Contubernalis alkaliaceticus TaxID=338645 RepID=UPI001F4C34D7|nr:UvrD-helicase domain-containing protein [Candidatus Contubernalis alkalaceticus]UNC91318.1 UvrD-helicase domain-containing protein [Candidatus Contubernalis alkalaceticus]
MSDFFDVEITTSDEMLQETLRGSADHRLKDIVATIQSEQNKIIRANLEKPLIVQGVAGSGKTTIALHRIAYLIYTYEKTFKPENFMIIAPNKVFLNYISDVLPELSVEEARQTTFAEFCFDLLNIKSKLTRQEEKLTILMDDQKQSEKQRELIEWASFFKGSMTFRKLIDNYLVQIQREMLPQEDVLLDVFPLMTAQEVEDNFIYEYAYLPIYKRLEQIKKKLSFRIRHKKKEFIKSVSDDYEQKIKTARFSAEDEDEARQKAVSLMSKRDEILVRIEKAARNLAASYIKKFKKSDTLSCYKKLITDPDMLQSYSPEVLDSEKVRYLCKASETYLKEKKLEPEDLAALLYLKSKLEGFRDKVTCRYVVIDEAQDFSLFQFYVLKHVLDTENFTILGDLSQGIYAYRGVYSWQDVEEQIFLARRHA